jgi:hypothetical protein
VGNTNFYHPIDKFTDFTDLKNRFNDLKSMELVYVRTEGTGSTRSPVNRQISWKSAESYFRFQGFECRLKVEPIREILDYKAGFP